MESSAVFFEQECSSWEACKIVHKEYLSYYEHHELEWGFVEHLTRAEHSTVKIIVVRPGEILSLQKHSGRDEFWRIVVGAGFVTIGEEKRPARERDAFFIHRNTI